MRYDHVTFENKAVPLDGHLYVDCIFNNCVIEYKAEATNEEWGLNGCVLTNTHLEFRDAAQRTLFMLTKLYSGGFKEMIEQTFEEIRNSKPN